MIEQFIVPPDLGSEVRFEVEPAELPLPVQVEVEPAEVRVRVKGRLVLRCSPAFHSWVVGLGDHVGLGISDLIYQSLRRMGDQVGYTALCPRRYRPHRHP